MPCGDPSSVSVWEEDFLNKERPDLAALNQQAGEDLDKAKTRFEIQMRSAKTPDAQNDAIVSFKAAQSVFHQRMVAYVEAGQAQRCKRDEDAHAANADEARNKAEADRPRIEAEVKAKIEAERAQMEADAKGKVRAQIAADLRAKAVADAKAKAETEAKADIEAATQAKDKAAADARVAADARLAAEIDARQADEARKDNEAADTKAREDTRMEAEAAAKNEDNIRAAKEAHEASVRADIEAAKVKVTEEARRVAEAKAAHEAAIREANRAADVKARAEAASKLAYFKTARADAEQADDRTAGAACGLLPHSLINTGASDAEVIRIAMRCLVYKQRGGNLANTYSAHSEAEIEAALSLAEKRFPELVP